MNHDKMKGPISKEPVTSGPRVKSQLSIISLDALIPNKPLSPNEPCELAPGITISILQSASEALIEIEESAMGSISIDNKSTFELATVRPGQIIQVSDQQYVLLKSLQALIVPRKKNYQRPIHAQNIIDLAIASTTILSESASQKTSEKDFKTRLQEKLKQIAKPAVKCHEPLKRLSQRIQLRTLILGIASALAIGLCCVDFPKVTNNETPNSDQKQSNSIAKSSIHAISNSTESMINKPTQESKLPAEAIAKQTINNLKTQTAVDALKAAMKPTQTKNIPKKLISNRASINSEAANEARLVKVSPKDRQLILEYRLEARFDRAKARAKMKDLKDSYPVGSPARAEIDQAYGSM